MNLRALLSFLTWGRFASTSSPSPQAAPDSAAAQCDRTHKADRKQVISRPFTDTELGDIDEIVRQMRGPLVKQCSPAPTFADAVEEVRQERLAAGPLDTRNADKAIDKVMPINRKAVLAKVKW